jgi:hypothetical protein
MERSKGRHRRLLVYLTVSTTVFFVVSPGIALADEIVDPVDATATVDPTTTADASVTVDPAPDATVTDPTPDATVTDPAPEAAVTDPAPDATVTDPAPDATVTDPAPDATVTDPAPAPDPTVTDTTPDATVDTVVEPVPQPASGPSPETATEPLPEVVTDPIPDVVSDSTTGPAPETAIEPYPEVVTDPITDVVSDSTTGPAPETAIEPYPEVVTDPITDVVSDSTTGPAPETAIEPYPEVVTDPIVEPVTDPIPEVVTDPVPELVAEPIPEPIVEPVPAPIVEPIPVPIVIAPEAVAPIVVDEIPMTATASTELFFTDDGALPRITSEELPQKLQDDPFSAPQHEGITLTPAATVLLSVLATTPSKVGSVQVDDPVSCSGLGSAPCGVRSSPNDPGSFVQSIAELLRQLALTGSSALDLLKLALILAIVGAFAIWGTRRRPIATPVIEPRRTLRSGDLLHRHHGALTNGFDRPVVSITVPHAIVRQRATRRVPVTESRGSTVRRPGGGSSLAGAAARLSVCPTTEERSASQPVPVPVGNGR